MMKPNIKECDWFLFFCSKIIELPLTAFEFKLKITYLPVEKAKAVKNA